MSARTSSIPVESKSAGDKGSGRRVDGPPVGRRIVKILWARKADLTEDDAADMRKVVGYVHRHLVQKPSGGISDSP
jgi:Protein of unknown function (DUF3140)